MSAIDLQRVPPCADQAWEAVADVNGWMTRGQSDLLCAAAASCGPEATIVEIGSFQGRSMIVLATCAPDDATLIAIDPHAGNDRGPQEIDGFADEANDDHDRFNENLATAGVADRVQHLRKFSDDALVDVDGPIDVLYIDGAHRYAPARADIERWGSLVKPGGLLLIHDSFSSIGVTAAIARSLTISTDFVYLTRSRSLAAYQRQDEGAPSARAGNIVAHARQAPYFAKNVGLKVLLAAGGGRLWTARGRNAPEWPY